MIKLIIRGIPTPWAAPKVCRKMTYDIRATEKKHSRIQVKSQYKGEVLQGPIRLEFFFEMPIPKGTSKKKTQEMIERTVYHLKKPDVSNLCKLYEDVLKCIVIADDSQVISISAVKYYALEPRTLITIHNE